MAEVKDKHYHVVKQLRECPSVYDTTHKYRGIATIVCFSTFVRMENDVEDLEYTTTDVKYLTDTFKALQFKTDVWDEREHMTKQTFLSRLDKVAMDDFHDEADCYVLVIISHGAPRGILLAYDEDFTVQDVLEKFTSDKCPKLAGKPKLLFFHACRGSKKSKEGFASGWRDENNPNGFFSIPAEADFLMMFSTFEGRVAYAAGKDGSAFVCSLTTVLNDDMQKDDEKKEHILQLMTHVCRATASFKWIGEDSREIGKQQPTIGSTMLRLYYLNRKAPL